MQIVSDFQAFIKQPFNSDMDSLHWFLFVGLILCILVAWNLILRHIVE